MQENIGVFLLLVIFAGLCATCIPGVDADPSDHVPMMFRADPWHSGVNDDGGTRPAGVVQWSFTTGDRVYSSPAVVEGMVYLGSDDGNLYAFDTETGVVVWNFTTGGRILASPAVEHDIVYVGSYDKNLYALDKDTGICAGRFPPGAG